MDIACYQEFAQALSLPIMLLDGEGTVRAVNNTLANQLQLPLNALVGQQLADCVAQPAGEISRYLLESGRSRQVMLGSLRLLNVKGHPITFQAEGGVLVPRSATEPSLLLFRLTPRDESLRRFLLLNQKIEELQREIKRRERAEAERDAQRQWLRVTMNSIGDAIIATDTQGRVSFLNPVAERMTGWTLTEGVGRPLQVVFKIFNETTRLPVENPVARVLREGVIVGLANHTMLVSRDGIARSIEDSASPIRDEQGRILGVVLVFHDVTERREMEQQLHLRADQLAEADRRKNEFLAMLAHELRNPLTPIRGTAQFLRSKELNSLEIAESAATLDRQVQHLTRMVDDLLNVARITRGLVELHPEPVELAQLVELSVDQMHPIILERQQTLQVNLPSAPLSLEVDPVRIVQVFCNLLSNASKFSQPGGLIRFFAEKEEAGSTVALRIVDEGAGMVSEDLPRIFEPFFQADRSLDRSLGGLGVGLTLAHGLVERHGGTLTALSKGPGLGSEFIVRLPLAEATSSRSEAQSHLPNPEPLPVEDVDLAGMNSKARRVLVVDDHADILWAQSRLLKLWGYVVETARDGPSALEVVRSFQPDVIVLDIGLPGMDGYEIASKIRQLPGMERVWLIAHSGYGHEEHRERAESSGFDYLIVKPSDPNQLRELLGSIEPRTPPDSTSPTEPFL